MEKKPSDNSEDFEKIIFRPWITTPSGQVIWAKNYGLKAFPIRVSNDSNEHDSKSDGPKPG